MAVREHPPTAEEASAQAFAGLHLLHGKVGPHRIGDRVEIFAGFQALLRQELNLGTARRYGVSKLAPYSRFDDQAYRFWNQI
jgi:hypothetical protein